MTKANMILQLICILLFPKLLTNRRQKKRLPKADAFLAPSISVCLPLYDTEPYLERCLRSIITQDYHNFEIVIVSDNSKGRDSNGRSAKQIAVAMQKECNKYRKAHGLSNVSIYFREHRENRGLIETRRTLMHESSGEYITMVDSDDVMEEGALTAFAGGFVFPAPVGGGEGEADFAALPDIIHGTTIAGVFGENGSFTPVMPNRYGQITYGTLNGHDIFRGWLMDKAMSGTSWGKLIKRELFVKAYDHIPYTECNMAEDFLLFFFISQYAKKYVGIKDKVYRYGVTTGMSSVRKINTLHKWKMVCSAASVFTVISQWIAEQNELPDGIHLAEDEVNDIRRRTSFYLANNLKQLKETVVPELQADARQMLCDYWGEHFVERMEEHIKSCDK